MNTKIDPKRLIITSYIQSGKIIEVTIRHIDKLIQVKAENKEKAMQLIENLLNATPHYP